MVDSAWAKTTLNNLEPTSLTYKHVGCWDSNVLKNKVAVAVRGIVITKDRHHALEFDAWGIGGDQNN